MTCSCKVCKKSREKIPSTPSEFIPIPTCHSKLHVPFIAIGFHFRSLLCGYATTVHIAVNSTVTSLFTVSFSAREPRRLSAKPKSWWRSLVAAAASHLLASAAFSLATEAALRAFAASRIASAP